MATGTFDPATFLDMQVTDAMSTAPVPIDIGEYPAVIEKVDIRPWTSKDGTKNGLALDITWDIDDAGQKSKLGRDKVSVRQGLMLDLNDSGGLDTGKGRNVGLGRLREALGLNQAGAPFSFRNLVGQVAKISVIQRPDGDQIYNDVKGVVKLA
jgi:hypothetical protein